MNDDWTDDAACTGKTELFFHEHHEPDTTRRGRGGLTRTQKDAATKAVADAKAICQECPVRPECLERAITTGETHGIWGGCDEHELRALTRARRRTRRFHRLICDECFEAFLADRTTQRFCGIECARAAQHRAVA